MSIVLIRKKLNSESSKSDDYNMHKALFERHSRTANTLFGENKKVKLLLSDLEIELKFIDQARSKQKRIEFILYSVLLSLSVGLMFIPIEKSEEEINKEMQLADRELIMEAEEFVNKNQLDEAKLILPKLNAENSVVLIKSKIQLSELISKLENLEPLIDKKEYSHIKLELDKLVWEKISNSWEEEGTERDYFRTFLKRKMAINNQLPEKHQIEIESEYSL